MKDKPDNVITFPKSNAKLDKESKTVEEINANMEMMKHYHIQETILNMAPIIFNQLDIAGFGLDEDVDQDIKDGAFIIESLRSLMLKYYGLYHPIQDIAENIFEENKKDPDGSYKIVKSLNLTFKTDDDETE